MSQTIVTRPAFSPRLAAIADEMGVGLQGTARVGSRWHMVTYNRLYDWQTWTNDRGTFSANALRCEQFEIGLPFKCFEFVRKYELVIPKSDKIAQHWKLLSGDSLMPQCVRLGIIFNVILYAIGLWVIWLMRCWIKYAIVQRRRRKLGLCPQCAHDLQGRLNTGCPECGWGRPQTENAVE